MLNKVLFRLSGIILFVLLIQGCAQKHYNFEYNNARQEIVWPQPPDKPRYRFVGFITGENNFVEDKSSHNIFNKSTDWLGKLIFGAEQKQGLFRPQGVLVDDIQKRLFVTDIGKKALFVFDMQQNKLQVWEQIDEQNKFLSPIAVAVNDKNEVFVSDSLLGYVAKFDQQGKFLVKVGVDILQRPTGLAVDKITKRLYVADAKQHQIFVFTEEGKLAFKIGGNKSEQDGLFNSPTYLTIANQELIVSDTLNARIQIFDLNGKWLRSFGKRGMDKGDLPRPKGVAVDSENHIYVIESYYDHLLVFDDHGTRLLPIGGNGQKPGQFDLPAGVWIDKQDFVYVADMFNSRISVFQYLK